MFQNKQEYCGLKNQGATCYLNAVLQILYMTKDYREHVRHMYSDGEFIAKLKELFNKLDNKQGPVSASGITSILGVDVFRQLDAAEYLGLILNETPEPSEVFMGTMEKTRKCKLCLEKAPSRTKFFSMHIPFEESQDVEDAVKAYMRPHELTDLYCRACKNMSQMTTECKIISFPKILIVQLQRRCDMTNSTYEMKVNIHPHIKVSSQKYELYAVLNRYGTFNFGHYNVQIKAENQNWYIFDDSNVTQIDLNRSSNAYLLLYKHSGGIQSDTEETESEHEVLSPSETLTNEDATQQIFKSGRSTRVDAINAKQNEVSDISAVLKLALKSEYQNKEIHNRQISDASTDFLLTEEPNFEIANRRQIKYNDIFKGSRIVLTKGEADTGKMPPVVKFILDWTDEKANQEIKYIFPIPFKRLNILSELEDSLSLMELLQNCCENPIHFTLEVSDKVLLILDGLHEANFLLDFENSTEMCNFTQSASFNQLLTNLIAGSVFQNILIWITTHPTAANKIPPKYTYLVTRVCNINQSTSSDQSDSSTTTQESTSINTLSPSVIDHEGEGGAEKTQKSEEAKMLSSCSIVEDGCAALRSDVGSELSHLKELDLSYNILGDSGMQLLSHLLAEHTCKLEKLLLRSCCIGEDGCVALISALESNLSHLKELDLSKNKLGDSGMEQLSHLLAEHQCKLEKLLLRSCHIREEDCGVLSLALRSNPSHLRELDLSDNDIKDSGVELLSHLVADDKCELEKLTLRSCYISDRGCAYLSSALRSNPSHLRELDLSDNGITDSSVQPLSHLVEDHQLNLEKLKLKNCYIGEITCPSLSSALRSNPSHLRELDLSDNDITDSEVEQISHLLKQPQCKLKKLWLRSCHIRKEDCAVLVSALRLNPSHLRELDLSNNMLADSGMAQLSDLLKNPQCKLEKLMLSSCHINDDGCTSLRTALTLNPSHLRELDLSDNLLGHSGIEQLSAILQYQYCTLEKLGLRSSRISVRGCADLSSALLLNPSHLRELDLSDSYITDSGLEKFSDLLKDLKCELEKLRLRSCAIGVEGCNVLSSALRSNPSHLRELDLSKNEIKDSGVELLSHLLKDHQFKLEKLGLRSCCIGEDGCAVLVSALESNWSHLKELDLSKNKLGDSGMEQLSHLLVEHQCKLEKLLLRSCNIGEDGCAVLVSALTSNRSHLKELDLSKNKLGDSGMLLLSHLLIEHQCKLEKLLLHSCCITEEGCAAALAYF